MMQTHPAVAPMQYGLTLIELMVVILVVGILVGFAIPGFTGLINQIGYNRANDQLIDTLTYARNEAIANGRAIVMCASGNTYTPQPTCRADQKAWQHGWIIFEDCHEDGVREVTDIVCDYNGDGDFNDTTPKEKPSDPRPDSIEPIIRIVTSPDYNISMNTNSAIRFQPLGTTNGNFEFTLTTPSHTGKVCINSLSRITVGAC